MANESFPQEVPGEIERRRAEVERQRNAQAQYYKVSGVVEVAGAGNAQVRVVFPVWFVDQPIVHFGGDLGDGSLTVQPGLFPSWNAMVHAWDYKLKPDGSKLFVGALLGILINSNDASPVTNIHWSVEGIGLRNPADSDDNTSDDV